MSDPQPADDGRARTGARAATGVEHVPSAFDDVASTYDLMVGLSPGYHDQLRRSADELAASLIASRTADGSSGPVRVLDLGCGSGASTVALVTALDAAGLEHEVVGVDGSAGMLEQARRKPQLARVDFRQADAEVLTSDDLGGEVDGVFAAYLMRNVAARDRLLGQLLQVLRPGGVLTVHDYSVRGDRRATAIWTAVCWGVIIPLGVVTARRSPIYRYLWRSVLDFDSVAGFSARLDRAGYVGVGSSTFGGLQPGVLHTWSGRRAVGQQPR